MLNIKDKKITEQSETILTNTENKQILARGEERLSEIGEDS